MTTTANQAHAGPSVQSSAPEDRKPTNDQEDWIGLAREFAQNLHALADSLEHNPCAHRTNSLALTQLLMDREHFLSAYVEAFAQQTLHRAIEHRAIELERAAAEPEEQSAVRHECAALVAARHIVAGEDPPRGVLPFIGRRDFSEANWGEVLDARFYLTGGWPARMLAPVGKTKLGEWLERVEDAPEEHQDELEEVTLHILETALHNTLMSITNVLSRDTELYAGLPSERLRWRVVIACLDELEALVRQWDHITENRGHAATHADENGLPLSKLERAATRAPKPEPPAARVQAAQTAVAEGKPRKRVKRQPK